MTEYLQLPQDSLPQSAFTDLSVISSSDTARKKRSLFLLPDESIVDIEDDEILLVVKKFLQFLGMTVV